MKTEDDAYLEQHTKRVISGYYQPLGPRLTGKMFSYRLDTCGITYATCPECHEASLAAPSVTKMSDESPLGDTVFVFETIRFSPVSLLCQA